jgi:hypothetical protein
MKASSVLSKSFVSFALTTFVYLGSFAQKSVTYEYKDFSEIEVSDAFELEIIQSDIFKVVIECDDALESFLEVELEGNELSIGLKNWKGKNMKKLKATVQMPQLNKLEANGASSVKMSSFKFETVEIELSGASSLNGKVEAKKMEIEASGASNVTFEGVVFKLDMYLSGASAIDFSKLTVSDELVLDCSGASKVTAKIDGDMFIKLSGASSFNYTGEGVILKQEVTGASSVVKG